MSAAWLTGEGCCYRCLDCGRMSCRDQHPSPGEDKSQCAECWDAEQGVAV